MFRMFMPPLHHDHVLQSARPMLYDDEHIQHPESGCDGNKEVTGENRLRMVLEKDRPVLVATRLPRWSLRQVLPDRSW